MTLRHIQEYRDPDICHQLTQQIDRISKRSVRLMEVCGTHTMAIFKTGLRSLLPDSISLLSGPGCPVCVTDQADIDAFITLSLVLAFTPPTLKRWTASTLSPFAKNGTS